ncbi:PepSY-associated TM helix domain-containing protein [Porticoccus sp. W117]|uniref:PepSY-associated TM helix domain-containing protein n=1 Tax=Porticoccus sp. W117 TaxID=3054777 RepID=UPI00259464AB|nr:PepSY-associated TM helix domain-containing protein [Porticoccus sp. W117]MDM3870469.1 PepSY-associated TM helix domain-containing protein [Porticoccus sp. W117]
MKSQILYRKIHHWGSIIIALPLLATIGTGILLMLKKEIEWIQPATQQGEHRDAIPTQSFDQLFAIAKAIPEMELQHWSELERVDVKPGKGVVKFVAANNWEAQIDTHSGELLLLAKRRSDVIEAIHDGSWFADWAKLGLFLPSGIVLLVLWLTGIYLFALMHYKRWQKHKRLAAKVQ